MTSNADTVLDQFTRQAAPFANSTAMRDEDALRLLVECSRAGADDTVLDVACGPGLVVAAFVRVCRHATGIDLTPAMIEKAREHAAALGLANVDWRVGNVLPLPFADGAFSVVVSRFAFHPFPDPLAVLREMARGCAIPRTPARSHWQSCAACSRKRACRHRARRTTTCAPIWRDC